VIKNIVIAINLLLVLVLGIYLLYDRQNSKKGYVINQRIFDGFKGKKELEAKLNQVKLLNKQKLDSLAVAIQKEKNNTRLALMYQDLLKSSQLQEEELSAKYTTDIWKHINESVAVFGKKEGYDFIFGASGDGGLMYANEANDITEKVVTYLNRQYGNAINE
jgi:outer membrane protein